VPSVMSWKPCWRMHSMLSSCRRTPLPPNTGDLWGSSQVAALQRLQGLMTGCWMRCCTTARHTLWTQPLAKPTATRLVASGRALLVRGQQLAKHSPLT
jgi:hypothetical protein